MSFHLHTYMHTYMRKQKLMKRLVAAKYISNNRQNTTDHNALLSANTWM